jgi:hypothetical protein
MKNDMDEVIEEEKENDEDPSAGNRGKWLKEIYANLLHILLYY